MTPRGQILPLEFIFEKKNFLFENFSKSFSHVKFPYGPTICTPTPNVTLISSDNVKVKGHSNILASCHYFKELFNKDKTGNSHMVFHESLSGDVLEFVVKYIYTAEYSLLDAKKLPEVIRATSKEKFNIPALAKSYLLKQLDAPGGLNQANWHLFYKNGIKLSLREEHFNRIYTFLKEKHPEFYKSEEFKSLTFGKICKIMKSPNRPFESIMALTEASLIWTTENTEVGMDKLTELSQICTNPIQNGNSSPQVANSMPILDEQVPVQSAEDSLSNPTCPQSTANADHLSTARKRSISPKINNLNSKRLNKRPNLNGIARNPPSISTLSSPPQSVNGPVSATRPQSDLDPTPSTSAATRMKTRMKTRANSQKNGTPNPNIKKSVVEVYHPPKYSWDSAQLLFFGKTEWSEPRYLWSYSFQSGEIKKMAKLPIENLEYSSLLVSQDRIYSIGGRVWKKEYPYREQQDLIWSFGKNDLENTDKAWEKGPNLNRAYASTLLFQNTIYLLPGNVSFTKFGIEKWDIDGKAGTPEDIDKPMLYNRYCYGVALLDNVIYMIGGKGKEDWIYSRNRLLKTAESYNIDDGAQSLLQNMNQARSSLEVVALKDRIYAIGGYNDGFTKFSTVESYKPGEPSWKQVASMNQPRGGGCAFVLDDTIYVVGGIDEAYPVYGIKPNNKPTMERYCPQEDTWTMVDTNLPEWAELSSAALLGPNNF